MQRSFRKPIPRQGPMEAKDSASCEMSGAAPSDQIEDHTLHLSEHTSRVPVLDRIRVPVSYDDLLVGEEPNDGTI